MTFRCHFSACFRTEPHDHNYGPEAVLEEESTPMIELENVRLIHATPDAEKLMAYCARVSSTNQENPDLALLKYCITHMHWSVFEMASLCLEITTSRAISPQIFRHKSFSFQEFSQRYAKPTGFIAYDARRQDSKNRQSSHDDLPPETKDWFLKAQADVAREAATLYEEAIGLGIAKESARFLLPLSTETKLYMHGTVRSWIHYLQLRTTPGTQKEHRDLALQARLVFADEFPITAEALGWPTSSIFDDIP